VIESIQIKNFRGIQEGQIEGFRKFNLLVGPNNSGKSAVMEALYLACSTNRTAVLTDSAHQEIHYSVRTADRDFLGDDPLERVLTRHSYPKLPTQNTNNDLSVGGIADEAPLQNFTLSIPNRLQNQEVSVSLFGLEVIDNVEGIGHPVGSVGNPWDLASQIWMEEIRNGWGKWIYCWNADLSYGRIGSSTWIVPGKLPSAQRMFFCDAYTAMNHLPMDFFRRMIATIPGWTQKIAEHYKNIFGVQKPFNVQFLPTDQEQKWAQGWLAPSDRVALTIDSYGDGARSIFKLLTPLLALCELAKDDSPGLLLWEEPELFQNPQTLGRLLAEVVELLRDKPIQLFIATHSLEVIANFTALAQAGKIMPDELRAFRLDLKEGQLKSSWFSADNLQAWTEMGRDPRVWGDFQSPLQCSFRKETLDEQEEAA
jgi:hypothetical protein